MRSERDLLRWLAAQEGTAGLLGDDTARLPEPAPRTVTVDSQIEGVHFPEGLDPSLIARRLLAVNLSDLAAAGAEPAYAFLALSTPRDFDHRRFFEAFLAACREHGVVLAGGDLASAPQVTTTLTLLGDPPAGGAVLRRSDAVAGHGLWVGGTLGESAAGQRLVAQGARLRHGRVHLPGEPSEIARDDRLSAAARRAVIRHLLPEAQLELGLALGRLPRQTRGAVMDVSDGLVLDLRRLCEASGVGAEVEAAALPRAEGFDELCAALGDDPVELVLGVGGGEDYVLLFTLPEGVSPPEGFAATRIGTVLEEPDLWLDRAGSAEPLPRGGWDHLRA